jgi:hypothetical protein
MSYSFSILYFIDKIGLWRVDLSLVVVSFPKYLHFPHLTTPIFHQFPCFHIQRDLVELCVWEISWQRTSFPKYLHFPHLTTPIFHQFPCFHIQRDLVELCVGKYLVCDLIEAWISSVLSVDLDLLLFWDVG